MEKSGEKKRSEHSRRASALWVHREGLSLSRGCSVYSQSLASETPIPKRAPHLRWQQ